MKNKITAVIPTRSGSQRLKNKNVRPFANKSLLQIKIDILKKLIAEEYIEKIVVNTNCEQSIDIAEKNNISVVKRDNYYASSKCPITEYWKEVLTRDIETDISMLCQVTSPLIKLETFKKCINQYNDLGKPIMTVGSIKDYIWFREGLELSSINYDYPNHPKSQDLNSQYFKINFGVVIISKDDLCKNNNVMTLKSTCISLDREECIDIDDKIDFKLAESIYLNLVS